MQHIYVIQPLSVVERAEKNSSVINPSDDAEGETGLSLINSVIVKIKTTYLYSLLNEECILQGYAHV